MIQQTILTIIIAFVAGILSATLGIGGGAITVPAFSMIAALPIKIAIGTSKFIMLFTTASGAIGHIRYKRVDWKTGLILEIMTIPGSMLGVKLVSILYSPLLKIIVGGILIVAGLNILLKRKKHREENEKKREGNEWEKIVETKDGKRYRYMINTKKILTALTISFLGGLAAGISGLGGGIVNVPVLTVIMNMPIHLATATSCFMIFLTAPPTSILHLFYGQVDMLNGLIAIPSVIIGAQIGTKIVGNIKPKNLRKIFAATLIIISFKMIYDGYITY